MGSDVDKPANLLLCWKCESPITDEHPDDGTVYTTDPPKSAHKVCPNILKVAKPPHYMADLPIVRGYPVPWFVTWINGVPEFRAADGEKYALAVRRKLCWVCGGPLGRYMTFVIGPMCGINRTTAEPPCHLECARYSAINCPFLSKPQMERRENDLPEGAVNPGGVCITRNPGVTLLWTTRSYAIFPDSNGRPLINVGPPTSMEWYSQGRMAKRAEVEHSVDTGLPLLRKLAEEEGPEAVRELETRLAWLKERYPHE